MSYDFKIRYDYVILFLVSLDLPVAIAQKIHELHFSYARKNQVADYQDSPNYCSLPLHIGTKMSSINRGPKPLLYDLNDLLGIVDLNRL